MKEDFLLSSSLAKELFRTASGLPVIDYHNHLSVSDLACNRKYEDMGELWLRSDPYKHRALRILGVDERFITGDASKFEKFAVWAQNLPRLIGNPLYHWTALEMSRVFGIDEPLSECNAESVWSLTNAKLAQDEYSSMKLLERFNVKVICPCTGLTDDLAVYEPLKDSKNYRIVPSLRVDDMVAGGKTFWQDLADWSGVEIVSLNTFRQAIRTRLQAFDGMGCRFADHSLDSGFSYLPDDGGNEKRLSRLLRGEKLQSGDQVALQSELLRIMGEEYATLNWTVQLHIGAQRFTSSRLRAIAGLAGGYACIGQSCQVADVAALLDAWEQNPSGLPGVILFTLNPADNAVMATLTGSFNGSGRNGKVQFGPAWWLNDHIPGMREHLEYLSVYGVLSTFIGMTTDSRSLLSFVRHEYFRRILCDWMADKVIKGEFPDNDELLHGIVTALCYGNAASYFNNL